VSGRPHLSTRSVVLTLFLGLLAGCGVVHVDDTDVSGAARHACTALIEDIPHRVSERARRETKGNSFAAAWGDPAIVLRCGVGTPDGYTPASPCQRADGVDWFVPEDALTDQDEDVVMTTIGREPAVEVVVPAEYRPPAATMVDLAKDIKQHTKVVSPCS
jgi:hypothetical protein